MRKSVLFLLVLTVSCGNILGKGKESEEESALRKFKSDVQSSFETLRKFSAGEATEEDLEKILSGDVCKVALGTKKLNVDTETLLQAKYVCALSFLSSRINKLISALNEVVKITIAGEWDLNALVKVLEELQSPPLEKPQSPTLTLKNQFSSVEDVGEPPYSCYNSGLIQLLCTTIYSIFLYDFERALGLLREVRKIAEERNIDFQVTASFPIKVKILVLSYTVDFEGIHDLSTVTFLESLLSNISAFIHLVFSTELSVGLADATPILEYVGGSTESILSDPLLHLGRIFTFLLKKKTLLQNLHTDELFVSQKLLTDSFEAGAKFSEFVAKEDNPEESQRIFFISSEGGKNYLFLRYKFAKGRQEPEVKVVKVLRERDLERFREIMDRMWGHLRDGNPPRISFARDVIPAVSTVLVGVIKSGILDPILNVLLSMAGQDIAQNAKVLLNSEFFTPTVVAGVISSFFGDSIELDLKTAYANLQQGKTHFRWWLPAFTWRYGRGEKDIQKLFSDNFIVSWDCGAKLYDKSITEYSRDSFGLICPTDQDTFHFADVISSSITEEEIAGYPKVSGFPSPLSMRADGFSAVVPYILWTDPSFGQLLWINPWKFPDISPVEDFLSECGVEDNFVEYSADKVKGNCALNSMLVLFLNNIFSIIKGGELENFGG